MIVENRKTGHLYDITDENWAYLVKSGMKSAFKIIEGKDALKKQQIIIPKQIIEFQNNPEKLKIDKTKTKTKE